MKFFDEDIISILMIIIIIIIVVTIGDWYVDYVTQSVDKKSRRNFNLCFITISLIEVAIYIAVFITLLSILIF